MAGAVRGSRVKRGRDWPPNRTEDGFGLGTVLAIVRDEKCGDMAEVQWDNGESALHRNGLNGMFDLEVVDTRAGLPSSKSSASAQTRNGQPSLFNWNTGSHSTSITPISDSNIPVIQREPPTSPVTRSASTQPTVVERAKRNQKPILAYCGLCPSRKAFRTKTGLDGHMRNKHPRRSSNSSSTSAVVVPGSSSRDPTSGIPPQKVQSGEGVGNTNNTNCYREGEEEAFGKVVAALMRPVPPARRAEVFSKVSNIISVYAGN